jgi:hypothetical protein
MTTMAKRKAQDEQPDQAAETTQPAEQPEPDQPDQDQPDQGEGDQERDTSAMAGRARTDEDVANDNQPASESPGETQPQAPEPGGDDGPGAGDDDESTP